MSTRNTIVFASDGTTIVHLYREMRDGAIHLEIAIDGSDVEVDLVIPAALVAGVTAILKRAEDPPTD